MKKVVEDTGYWSAVNNDQDKIQDKAQKAQTTFGHHLLIKSKLSLSEVAAYFSDKGSRLRQGAVDLIRSIRANPNSRVVPQTSLQFQDALALYEQSADKEWSLTDCASFLIMRELKISETLAHDKHFEQSGFVALLRE